MKRRVVKKVEKRMLVDKVCELQREICEHERFEGELLVMLVKRNPEMTVIKHGSSDYFGIIWDRVVELLKENERLARNLNENQ